ncbi:MAG: DUF4870 domain-containing protein [Verrucomicrobia bacterium]|nr:DUF4870 domain-containing protein [Verrucomicrobiota bacterium]
MSLKNVYLVVDGTTAQFLRSRRQSEVIDFTVSCIRGIAGEVVNDVVAWMDRAHAVPSVVQLPGAFSSGRIAEFLSENCGCDHGWSMSNSAVMVKTGQTTFGGSFAVCLVTNKTPQGQPTPVTPQAQTASASAPKQKQEAPWAPPSQNWRLYLDLCALAGIIIPFGNILGPMVLWLAKKDTESLVKTHGPDAMNFHVSWTIWTLVTCGIGVVVYFVFWIIRVIKFSNGEDYKAPLTLSLIK